MRIESTSSYIPKAQIVQPNPQQKAHDTHHAHMAASKFTELLNQVGDGGTKSGGYKLSAFQMSGPNGTDEQQDGRGGILV